jgi:ElaB/YqjD/DUF883 family membrane-anchored ribosome-binding protein
MTDHNKHSESAADHTSANNGHHRHEGKRVSHIASDAQEQAKEVLESAKQEVKGLASELKERLGPADSFLRTTTKDHPYLTVGSAVGLSFLAGFLMRRRAAIGAGAAVGFLTGCLISRQPLGVAKEVGEGER